MAMMTQESSGRSNMLSDMLVSVHPIVSVVNESFADIRRIDLEAHGMLGSGARRQPGFIVGVLCSRMLMLQICGFVVRQNIHNICTWPTSCTIAT
jgi:hypothetical protein